MAGAAHLPVIDLSSADRASAAASIRGACLEHGFFYVINHGVDEGLIQQVFEQSRSFFQLPHHEKMRLKHNADHRGYTPPYSEVLDPSSNRGADDFKESFYIGPFKNEKTPSHDPNQWPSEEVLPIWRKTMTSYHRNVLSVGKKVLSLIALSLGMDEHYFEKAGALHEPMPFLRLLHYPGYPQAGDYELCGTSAHSDYGLITLLISDGVPGLQICCERDKQPQTWENVHHICGAFIVNVGDLLERWTNCLFRSTLHRVVATGQERYSVAFFLDPNYDCIVECLETCCSKTRPKRFPPIKAGEHLHERLSTTYASNLRPSS